VPEAEATRARNYSLRCTLQLIQRFRMVCRPTGNGLGGDQWRSPPSRLLARRESVLAHNFRVARHSGIIAKVLEWCPSESPPDGVSEADVVGSKSQFGRENYMALARVGGGTRPIRRLNLGVQDRSAEDRELDPR